MKLLLFIVRLIPPALLRWLVRWRFKTVRQRAPALLVRTLISRPVLLLDVRTRAEFASEHLANAVHVTDAENAQRFIDRFRDDTPQGIVVAYCTVGYRSAQFVERMAATGGADVENLEGGIWAWIAADQPVVRVPKA